MAALEDAGREPIAPQYLMAAVSDLVTDAILTCDSGTIATWAARHWTIRGDRRFYLSGNLATMAPGLPYAVAIQHAFPDRQVIAFVGDAKQALRGLLPLLKQRTDNEFLPSTSGRRASGGRRWPPSRTPAVTRSHRSTRWRR